MASFGSCTIVVHYTEIFEITFNDNQTQSRVGAWYCRATSSRFDHAIILFALGSPRRTPASHIFHMRPLALGTWYFKCAYRKVIFINDKTLRA